MHRNRTRLLWPLPAVTRHISMQARWPYNSGPFQISPGRMMSKHSGVTGETFELIVCVLLEYTGVQGVSFGLGIVR